MDLGRRGVGRNNIDGLGPTGLVGKPPPSGGGGGVTAETAAVVCPATVFGAKWGPHKN